MDNLKLGPGDVISEIVDKVSFSNFVSNIFLYKKTCEVTVSSQSTFICQHLFSLQNKLSAASVAFSSTYAFFVPAACSASNLN
jgi:uncharacterized membrane protein